MAETRYLRLALPTTLRKLFDYLPNQGLDLQTLKPGMRVLVPFQRRQLVGILVDLVDKTTVPYGKLKTVTEILDTTPILPEDVYQLCQWAAEYYHYSFGDVLSAALPALLRKGNKIELEERHSLDEPIAKKNKPLPLVLNEDQQKAVDTISASRDIFNVFMLDGVTGSGKTEVYLRVMEAIIQQDKQVLMLVPEISLTPQTIARFRERFDVPMVTLHSGLSDKERLQAWLAAREGNARIVIGTRSAVFTPFKSLGLIIVDEEHDTSFKQQDRFRYHARDLSIMRANTNQIPVVLGSATPSLESLLNVKRNRYQSIILPNRAGEARLPTYQMVDLRRTTQEEGLSKPLIDSMKMQLNAGNQVMLFLNRRGYAPVLYCTECTWIAGCRRCDTRMVYHNKPERLQCHHCDSRIAIPKKCGQCSVEALQPVGIGTQRLEETLKNYFPDTPILRVDRDSTRRKGAMQSLLDQVHEHKKAILIGTQMLAKGHHFPNVTLVGMIDADSGLFSADFRAAEQMGQLLVQVVGRAGREDKPGTVMIQTNHPDHPLLQTLIHKGYHAFSNTLLIEREEAVMPPYTYFAVFRAEANAAETASQFLEWIKKISATLTHSVTVLGPVPALMAKRKGLHRQQLLVRADKRSTLQHFLKGILQQIDKQPSKSPVKWMLDVDPVEVV